MSNRICAREWWIAIAIACGLTLLLQLPYLLGYLTTRADVLYTGLLVNVEDANYITIIQRGREGAWTHSLRFTSEPDAPAFLYVFYLAWGQLARIFDVDATTMWHLARAALTMLTFLLTYGFIATFVENHSQRKVAFALAVLGAGFDWFALPWETLAPTSATPADLKMADAHLFHAALTFPHYLASISLLLILFWCATRLLTETLPREKTARLVILGALANVGVVLVYPFFVLLACGVLIMFVLLSMARAKKFLLRQIFLTGLLIVPALPLALYYGYALASSELLRVWAAQSQTLSPHPLHYLLTFAPYLILAGLSLVRVGEKDERRVLLWAWVLTVALLVYAPLGAQRRFLQGVQIPLALLAAFGWFEVVLPRVRRARWIQTLAQRPNYSIQGLERLVTVLLVLLVCISSVYQWLSAIALTTILQPYPLFRPRAEVQAMDWLREGAHADDVVLSAYFTGSYLPLRSGARAYLGHFYETIHFADKQKNVEEFFQATTDDHTRRQFLRDNQITFVFYGRAERALGAFDPQRATFLEPQFASEGNIIYRVVIP